MTDTLADSYAYCRKLARRTAKNFYYSFMGLPPQQFRAMCVLYSYMRLCDDIGDDEALGVAVRRRNLDAWEADVRAAFGDSTVQSEDATLSGAGRRVFPALVDMMREFEVPTCYLFEVIDGIRMDLEPVSDAPEFPECRFQTFNQLEDYCYHVAGVVGRCCIHIWGFTDDRALELAVDCGLAFQLTNILRDLAEDADSGRIYLPAEDLARFEYLPQDIRNRARNEQFDDLMTFQCERAERYYESVDGLFELLKPTGRPILSAMLKIYGGLLSEIRRRGFDVYSGHVSLPRWQKLLIAAGAAIEQKFGRTPTTVGTAD